MSILAPLGWVVSRPAKERRPRLPDRWALAVSIGALATSLWLFGSIQPFHPDHDDTFRAGFVRAILWDGFPPSQHWWTAAASGTVAYYVLIENIVAQVGVFTPHLATIGLYTYYLKLFYIVCNALLGFSIACDLGGWERVVVPGRIVMTVSQSVVAFCAFLMLVFGATPFELASLHILAISQSEIVHTVLLIFVALILRPTPTSRADRIASAVVLWSLPAILAAAKFPFVPAFVCALGLHWLLKLERRKPWWMMALGPAYLVISSKLAMQSSGLLAAAEKHPIAWVPLRLFRSLSPEWFHFKSWPLLWRIAVPLGLYIAPVLLLMLVLALRRGLALHHLRSPAGRALMLTGTVVIVAYVASSTIGFRDPEGNNEGYWLIQGWSALNVFVFVAILAAPPSWLKVVAIPFAFYAVNANYEGLRRTATIVDAPLNIAALDDCDFVNAMATGSDSRKRSLVAHPFRDWDFAACTSLPSIAPPDDRYDRFARANPKFASSKTYMQELVTAPSLPEPPPSLSPALSRYAYIFIIRRIDNPLIDSAARLVHRNQEHLIYEWFIGSDSKKE